VEQLNAGGLKRTPHHRVRPSYAPISVSPMSSGGLESGLLGVGVNRDHRVVPLVRICSQYNHDPDPSLLRGPSGPVGGHASMPGRETNHTTLRAPLCRTNPPGQPDMTLSRYV